MSVFILAVFDMTGVRFLRATLSRAQKNQVIFLADMILNVSGLTLFCKYTVSKCQVF